MRPAIDAHSRPVFWEPTFLQGLKPLILASFAALLKRLREEPEILVKTTRNRSSGANAELILQA
jgi:hypothetical protein